MAERKISPVPAAFRLQSIQTAGPVFVTLSNGEREIVLELSLRQICVWEAFERVLADAHCELAPAELPPDSFRFPERRAWWLGRVAERIQHVRSAMEPEPVNTGGFFGRFNR